MTRLAAFVITGYWQAVICIAGFAWLTLWIPFVSVLSGAAVGLFAFRFGYQRAIFVTILSAIALIFLLFVTDFSQVVSVNINSALLFLLLQWLPVIGLIQLVRNTQSLSVVFQQCAALGILTVLGFSLLVPNSATLWADFFDWASQGEINVYLENRSEFAAQYGVLLNLMTGFAVSSVLFVWITSLLLAYWWQSLLFEPGGFKKSFTRIKLGKVIAAFGLVILAATTFVKISLVTELIVVLMTVFLFQGIATVHFLLGRLGGNKFFFTLFYSVLVLSPIMPLLPGLIGVLGMLEEFVNLRNRLAKSDIVG